MLLKTLQTLWKPKKKHIQLLSSLSLMTVLGGFNQPNSNSSKPNGGRGNLFLFLIPLLLNFINILFNLIFFRRFQKKDCLVGLARRASSCFSSSQTPYVDRLQSSYRTRMTGLQRWRHRTPQFLLNWRIKRRLTMIYRKIGSVCFLQNFSFFLIINF